MRAMAAALAIVASACAMAPAPPVRRDALVGQIADDAATFNEAYAQAVNGQILLNILRSRDRQPRYYLSTTGISDAPSMDDQFTASVGGLGLGHAFKPWGVGSLTAHRETSRRPSYAVQPLGADVLIKAVFQPTPNNVFQHYWESGWPRDLLVMLMVRKIAIVKAGRVVEYVNEANDMRADCTQAGESRGCGFERIVRQMLTEIGDLRPADEPTGAPATCGLIDAYAPGAPVRRRDPAKGEICNAVLVAGDAAYRLELRSFDDMVYYVGELMRLSYTQSGGDPEAVLEAPVKVRVSGLRGGGAGTPLFRILPEKAAGRAAGRAPRDGFAANVEYAGHRYFAGQAVGRSCADAASAGLCVDDAARGDRSSSVLSLLAELLALNQSPDSIRAPGRIFTE